MSAIGFAVTLDAFHELVEHRTMDSARFDTPLGGYLQWRPGAGAELWLQVNAVQKIVGCNPHFGGEGRIEASIIETVSAPGRPLHGHCFGWAAPRDPGNPYTGLHAIAANLPNFAYVDEPILMPAVVTLQVAAFASAVDCFPTEAAFAESEIGQREGAEPGHSVWRHTEEEGMPQPEAFLSGFVMQSERRENPVTGQEFQVLMVRTDAGTIDVVADIETAPRRPVAGTVIAGTFWLSACVISELPPVRRQATFQRARAQA